MSTTTRNSSPGVNPLSTDEDQQKAIDQLFLQIGQKGSIEQPMQRPTSVAMRAIDPLTQSPRLGHKREPLPQQNGTPIRRRRAVPATCEADDESTWGDRLRQVIFVGCLALAAMVFVKAIPASWFGIANSTTVARPSATIAPVDTVAETKLQTIPIEKVQVGDRVVGTNPVREQAEGIEPDPATWRKISLHMRKESGLSLSIDLLRPLEWIEKEGAQPGATIFLDLFEMGAIGDAEVTYLGPCPTIKPGKGTVVTGKFTHQADASSNVVHLRLEGQPEATGVTDNHPYWSEDRQSYVEVGRLRIGELVNTEFGLRCVASITPYSDYDGLLYNIETTEHVYRVGSLGTLVHNSCALTRYADDGGHHVFSKRAFKGVSGYKAGDALSIGQQELSRLGLKHLGSGSLTTTQQRLFRELAASGRPNTLTEHARIARETLIEHGVAPKDAARVVQRSLDQLKSWGITAPVHIPWGG